MYKFYLIRSQNVFKVLVLNSCFIDNCVFKEWESRETVPFLYPIINIHIKKVLYNHGLKFPLRFKASHSTTIR